MFSKQIYRITLQSIVIFYIFTCISMSSSSEFDRNYREKSNCYAEAVYDELMLAINTIKAASADAERIENDATSAQAVSESPNFRRFQEEEDYGNGNEGGLEIPPIVPMIFKIVGSALSLNSSGVTENSFGFIPERLSNRLTSVLGNLAGSILGISRPTTPRPPPPRRRRRSTTTTTTPTTTSTDATTEPEALGSGSVEIDAETFPSSSSSAIENMEYNETSSVSLFNETETTPEADIKNGTEVLLEETSTSSDLSTTTFPEPTTTATPEVLFKESNLGELPVYAAAYAPNYIATTPYPVYASNFLHVLYAAPTTTTTTPSTTADPNSYNVALPFDYQEKESVVISSSSAIPTKPTSEAVIFNPSLQIATTPVEEYEYEYEEQTEGGTGAEAAAARVAEEKEETGEKEDKEEKDKNHKKLMKQTETGSGDGGLFPNKNQVEDEDEEYLDNDLNKNRTLSSLGRISRFIGI